MLHPRRSHTHHAPRKTLSYTPCSTQDSHTHLASHKTLIQTLLHARRSYTPCFTQDSHTDLVATPCFTQGALIQTMLHETLAHLLHKTLSYRPCCTPCFTQDALIHTMLHTCYTQDALIQTLLHTLLYTRRSDTDLVAHLALHKTPCYRPCYTRSLHTCHIRRSHTCHIRRSHTCYTRRSHTCYTRLLAQDTLAHTVLCTRLPHTQCYTRNLHAHNTLHTRHALDKTL